MKIRFSKDATGPFVEVTHTVRDQDDLVGADFYALSPEDRAKVCEHLPRAVNDRLAVRDHSEAEQDTQSIAILNGLRALEEQLEPHSIDGESPESTLKRLLASPPPGTVAAHSRWFAIPEHQQRSRIGQIVDQLADVRHELSAEDIEAAEALIELAKGAPTPLDRAVGEVCAVDVGAFADPVDAIVHAHDAIHDWLDTPDAEGVHAKRETLLSIARVALAGMLACDAPATKEPG